MIGKLKALLDKILLRSLNYETAADIRKLRQEVARLSKTQAASDAVLKKVQAGVYDLQIEMARQNAILSDQAMEARIDLQMLLDALSRQIGNAPPPGRQKQPPKPD